MSGDGEGLNRVWEVACAARRGSGAGRATAHLRILLAALLLAVAGPARSGTPLVSDRLLIQGTRLSIAPGDDVQVLNVAETTTVRTCFAGVCGGMAAGDPRVSGILVEAELSGPELPAPMRYAAVPGGAFLLPGFQAEGTYVLSNIRLVRAGTGEVLGSATPAVVVLEVRQILLSSATVRQLSLEDLKARGIEVTQENLQGVGRLETITSAAGVVTVFTYDAAGRVSAERRGSSGPRRRIYDPNGRVAVVTDGDQGVYRARYDAWGRVWAEDHPTGARVERAFDRAGGLVRETTWDRADEATRTLLAETETNVTSFGSLNEVVSLLTAVPRTRRLTRKSHDEAGRLVKVTSGPSEAIQRDDLRVSYDAAGRPVVVTDGGGNETRHGYETEAPWPTKTERYESVPGLPSPILTTTSRYGRDAHGRVVEEDRGDGTIVRTELDQAGNVTSVQLGLEAPTRSTYDGAGRVVAVERPAGRGYTVYGYDRDGRLRARVSAGHERVNGSGYHYESQTGRLSRIEHPDGTVQEFTYNPDDTVDLWTKRSGIRLRHVYDPANRLLARQVAGAGGPGAPQTDGGETFGWDPLSRLVSVDRPASNAPAVAYLGYDSAGRPRDEVVGNRPPLSRVWDTWSREAEVFLPVGIGGHEAGGGYSRAFDNLDRVAGLTGIGSPALGASFSWGGTARLYGQTTNGSLHVSHRYSYLGSGLGPQPGGTVASPWRLGILSVGSSFEASEETAPPSHVWGQLGYGYRPQAGLKVGRKVLSSPSLLSGQGWAWGLDASRRLSWAEPGAGTLEEEDPSAASRFEVTYGAGDEVRAVARVGAGEATTLTVGIEGRILSRDGVPFTYDLEGHRTSDDRYEYGWSYRDELLSITVKPCWPETPTDGTSEPSADCPGQVRPLHAGQQVRLVRDALGRVFAERRLGPPSVPGDESSRPFLEEKEFLWAGGTLLAEAGRAADGALLWRKSYVPGPSGLDDAVQLRVERYDLAGERTSDRLLSFIRDEQGTVLALVDESEGADPARPNVLVRNLYDPWGQAHAEVGPEVRAASFEASQLSLVLPSGATASQSIDPETALGGRLRIVLSLAADGASLPEGLLVERRLSDGTWGALTASDLALARDPSSPESALVLPLSGWLKGTTYRVRLTGALRDVLGRPPSNPPTLEIPIPADGSPVAWERAFPVFYETFLAAGETANGAIPGGQSILWQGAWTSSLGGHQLKRARVYDPRTASFLSEDPLDDIDSPNLYGYVAGRPHEATDPWGLLTFFTANVGPGDVLPTLNMETGNKAVDAVLGVPNNIFNFVAKFVNAGMNFGKGAAVVQDKVDEKAWEKGIACRGCTTFSMDMAGLLLGTAEGRFAMEATAPARQAAVDKVLGKSSRSAGAKSARVPGPYDALSSNAKGEVGKAWSREAALARGEKIVGEEMDLIFTINGKDVGVRPDLLTKLPGEDTYVYIESKFSRQAGYTAHQEIVIPELVKAGDSGLVAKVGARTGSLDPGAKIRVVFQGDTWDRGPALLGQ